MKYWLRLIITLGLLGCATPKTPEELRDLKSPDVLSSLSDYQEIYTKLGKQLCACCGVKHEMRSALYTHQDRGAIGVFDGDGYLILVEVFKSPDGFGSQVTVHSWDGTLSDRVHA